MSINEYYNNNVQKKHAGEIEKKYKLIKFEDSINVSEAEIIFQKYVLDNGWPWELTGGHTKLIDNGDNWVIKYMDCIGRVDDKANWVLIDKKTGKVKIVQPR